MFEGQPDHLKSGGTRPDMNSVENSCRLFAVCGRRQPRKNNKVHSVQKYQAARNIVFKEHKPRLPPTFCSCWNKEGAEVLIKSTFYIL